MEELLLTQTDKESRYRELLPQIQHLIEPETNLVANLANVAAALHQAFPNWWTGWYLVHDNQLVLGPFQGPIACTRINFGKGVCGSAWKRGETILVPNVDEFPGHIACSSLSKSEIVVPVFKNNRVVAVLDVDSAELAAYDHIDALWLEKIGELIASKFPE
ncbi:MAG: GAF domain-containing protein [Bacteroidia bacterium]|nr:GAF domain-containing protein [Bacteroidia bacterium]